MEDQRLSDEFSSETITDSEFFSSGEALIVSEIPKKVIILYSFLFFVSSLVLVLKKFETSFDELCLQIKIEIK